MLRKLYGQVKNINGNYMQRFVNIDQLAIRRYRLNRVRSLAAIEDVATVLLFDPVNIRYANGSRNMQVWTRTFPKKS